MPALKISAPIARAIRASHDAGASHRAIATEIHEKFDVEIEHSTIGRYLAASPPLQRPRATGQDQPDIAADDDASPLDELSTLEECARDLRRILRTDEVDHRARPGLNAELRQTLRQIRQQKQAVSEAKQKDNDEATRLRDDLLRRFSPTTPLTQPTEATSDEDDDDAGRPDLPDVRRASGSR